ncbi:MAG: HAMP domain-containing sensor histidine kinase [Pseudomonadota bacterium]|nr:HAMP domain-containing sensor histidine kinase [Pseudomonadota bacterium]
MPTRDTWSDGLSPDEILVRAGRIGWLVHAVVVGLAALGLNALDMPQVAVGLAATGIPLSLVIAAIMFRGFNLAAYFVLTGLAGIMWGTLALAVAPSGLGEATLFVTLVIGGTAAAAIAIQFPRPWLVATSLAPALTGLTIAHLLPATPLGLSIAPMVLIYGLLLALLARYMREIFNANLRLTAQLSEQVDALGRAVEERDRATAVKQRLLRHTGHDMRQALHAVKFVLHFLRDQRLSDETRELVTRGQRSLDVLGGLFQSIQDISQIQSERIEVRHEPVVLGSLLRRATSTLAGEARQREIALHVIPSTARVETDPLLLQRIVQNIAANAVKFAGSRVVIGVRRRAGRFTIEILDDGPGIPRERQDEIFEEFTQLQPGTGEAPGLGLGLAIVRELSGKLGLEVSVDSRLGAGTRFAIGGWPVQGTDLPVRGTAAICALVSRGEPDPDLRRAARLAGEWGYRVVEVDSTVQVLSSPKPDIVIVASDVDIDQALALTGGRLQRTVVLGRPVAADGSGPALHLAAGWRPAQLRSAVMSCLRAPG